MTFPLNFGTDIKTRVVLSNETSHTSITQGMAGKVGVIGAFPTDRTDVVAVSSYPEFLSEYNLKSTKQEDQYDGMRALKYIFMTQFPNIPGATSVTCVNINGVYSPESDLTVEANDSVVTMKADVENRIAELNSKIATKKQRKQTLQNKTNKTPEETAELAGLGTEEPNNSGEYVGEIGALAKERDTLVESLATFNQLVDKYVEEGIARISADRHLTFNKLKTALTQLAEEDLDLLFISSNLWDCTEGFDGDDDEDVDSKGQARHIGIVYEYILNFINEGFF